MAVTRAFELRDRMTDRERYHAIGLYHIYVDDDFEAAATAYSTLLDLYPEDSWALNNIGQAYSLQGQTDLAIVMYNRAIDADPYSSSLSYTNLISDLYFTGDVDSARVVLDRLGEAQPGHPYYDRYSAALAMAEGEYDEAEAKLGPLLESEMLGQRRWATNQLSAIEYARGRVERAARLRREAAEDLDSLDVAFFWSGVDVDLRHDTATAVRRLERAVTQVPDSVVADRGIGLGFWYTWLGRPQEGREYYELGLVADSLRVANAPPWLNDARELWWESAQTYAAGDFEDALRAMERAIDLRTEKIPDRDPATDADDVADLLYVMGDREGAIEEYERWLGRRQLFRAWSDDKLAPTLERVAQLYDELGDTESAAIYYAQFVDVWQNADPEFQPRLEAARARLEEIVRERG
jgi:tetratricopeptide (TPR) repeat protein